MFDKRTHSTTDSRMTARKPQMPKLQESNFASIFKEIRNEYESAATKSDAKIKPLPNMSIDYFPTEPSQKVEPERENSLQATKNVALPTIEQLGSGLFVKKIESKDKL